MTTEPSGEKRSRVAALVVAIDGPAGAGKSTVGRALASRLGIEYLDTGAMYRAMTFAVLNRGIAPDDVDAVAAMARSVDIELANGRVVVDGEDATTAIRGVDVTEHVSMVSANSVIREELRYRQREWVAERGGAVVEGRDIGSVVFPDAPLKLFITASPRVRAQRRVSEIGGDIDAVERTIIERDRRDSSRADSPLTTTPDMVVVDTTSMSIGQVVAHIAENLLDPLVTGNSGNG